MNERLMVRPERLRSESAIASTAASAAEPMSFLEKSILETPNATLFTNKAVASYKEATLQNILERTPRKYQILRHLHNPLTRVSSMNNVVAIIAAVALVLSLCTFLFSLMWLAGSYFTGAEYTGPGPKVPFYAFAASAMLFICCYAARSLISNILHHTNLLTWSVIKPVGGLPNNAGLVLSTLHRKLAPHGTANFQIHTLGADPFLSVSFVSNESGVIEERFFFGWDNGYRLIQTGDRIHFSGEYV